MKANIEASNLCRPLATAPINRQVSGASAEMMTFSVLIVVRKPQLETALKEFFQLREMEVPSSEER